MKTTPETELIRFIAQETVSGRKDNRIRDLLSFYQVNWARVKEIAEHHEIYSFVYPAIKGFSSVLPADLMEFFRVNYFGGLLFAQYLWRDFLEIWDKFEARGIAILPIKGISFLADIYAQMPCRRMVDIDVLVKKENIEEAKEIFLCLGYEERLDGLKEEYWLNKQCHIAFLKKADKRTIFVDMHFGLDFKRKGREILPRLWNRIRELNIDGRSISLLSPEDAFFSLALHQRRFGNILNLKNILDVAMILHKYNRGFDWDYVIKEAAARKMRANIFFILLQAKIFFEVSIPQSVWEDLNVPLYKRVLMKRLIEKNTFALPLYQKMKGIYLKSHFLLYDSLWEPMEYILNIPQEQFAKFYGLQPYAKKTAFFYHSRLFYMSIRGVGNLFSRKDERY